MPVCVASEKLQVMSGSIWQYGEQVNEDDFYAFQRLENWELLPNLKRIQNCLDSFFPTMLQTYCYFTAISMANVRQSSILFVPPAQTNLPGHSMLPPQLNRHHFLCFKCMEKFDLSLKNWHFLNTLPCGCFPAHYNFSQESVIIYSHLSSLPTTSFDSS